MQGSENTISEKQEERAPAGGVAEGDKFALENYLIDSVQDAVFIKDADMRYLRINPPMARLLGKSQEEVAGKTVLELNLSGDVEQIHRRDKEALLGRVVQGDATITVDGEPRLFHTIKAPVYDNNGEIIGICGIARDMTEDRAAESQLRALNDRLSESNRRLKEAQTTVVLTERLAAVGQLAEGMAHEINNPTSYIISNLKTLGRNLELLQRAYRKARNMARQSGAEARAELEEFEREHELSYVWKDSAEMVEESLQGVERIKQVVKDLQSFARPPAKESQEVDLNSLISTTVSVLRNHLFFRAGLELDLDELPPVKGDPALLGQVILNIVRNAVESIPEGRSAENTITLSSRAVEDSVVITVSDTGVGISPEVLPRVFDAFFTTKPVGEGTGLGLSISYGIVKKHGGNVELESTPGLGTKAVITLPALTPRRRETGAAQDCPKARVLVVDDEPIIIRALQRSMPPDYVVLTAGSGADALHIVGSGCPLDAVVCDIIMPDMSGAEVYQRAVEKRPELEKKFVFMTGGAFTPKTRHFLANTDLPCLKKPFETEELLGRIEKLVSDEKKNKGA